MPPTFDQVAKQIRSAASYKDLLAAANLIGKVGGFDEQNQLGKIYKQKAAEFRK